MYRNGNPRLAAILSADLHSRLRQSLKWKHRIGRSAAATTMRESSPPLRSRPTLDDSAIAFRVDLENAAAISSAHSSSEWRSGRYSMLNQQSSDTFPRHAVSVVPGANIRTALFKVRVLWTRWYCKSSRTASRSSERGI